MGALRIKMFSGDIEDIDRQMYDFLELENIQPTEFLDLKLWYKSEFFQSAIVYEKLDEEEMDVAREWNRLPEELDEA